MGNKQSAHQDEWKALEAQNPRISGTPALVSNSSGTKGYLYEIQVPKSIDMNQMLKNYEARKSSISGNLINVYHVSQKDQFFECAGTRQTLSVVTEYIPFRLYDHRNLTMQQASYILDGSLSGFQELKDINGGAFLVNDKMIGADENGKVKVWENEIFGLNEVPTKLNAFTEQNMIYELFNSVRQHTNKEGFEKIEKSINQNQMRTFPQAKNALKRFIYQVPNYNEVNLGYSLLPKTLLKSKNIASQPNIKNSTVHSQIIQRESVPQEVKQQPILSQPPNYSFPQNKPPTFQSSFIQRQRSSSAPRPLMNAPPPPARQIVPIQEERVPLFIRQRQQAKIRNVENKVEKRGQKALVNFFGQQKEEIPKVKKVQKKSIINESMIEKQTFHPKPQSPKYDLSFNYKGSQPIMKQQKKAQPIPMNQVKIQNKNISLREPKLSYQPKPFTPTVPQIQFNPNFNSHGQVNYPPPSQVQFKVNTQRNVVQNRPELSKRQNPPYSAQRRVQNPVQNKVSLNLMQRKPLAQQIGVNKSLDLNSNFFVLKEEARLEKPPSKRQFISKTTEISIVPPSNKNIGSQVFDEYHNRPLTGIQEEYKKNFIDEKSANKITSRNNISPIQDKQMNISEYNRVVQKEESNQNERYYEKIKKEMLSLNYSSFQSNARSYESNSFNTLPKQEHTDYDSLFAKFNRLENENVQYGRSVESYSSFSTEKKTMFENQSPENIEKRFSNDKIEEVFIKQETSQGIENDRENGFMKIEKIYEAKEERREGKRGEVYESSMEPFIDYTQGANKE